MNTALRGLWLRLLRRVSPYTLLAVALLLAAAGVLVWTQALDRQSDTLRRALATRRAAQPANTAPVQRQMPLGEQVDAFVDAVPALQASATDLEQVFRSADLHKLQLPKGEYKFKQSPNEPLASYTATFPVHADYGSIRDFCADVLRALPNASMEELRMARSSADSTVLEAVVRFTFVYRR